MSSLTRCSFLEKPPHSVRRRPGHYLEFRENGKLQYEKLSGDPAEMLAAQCRKETLLQATADKAGRLIPPQFIFRAVGHPETGLASCIDRL